jgi:hypothetical protein
MNNDVYIENIYIYPNNNYSNVVEFTINHQYFLPRFLKANCKIRDIKVYIGSMLIYEFDAEFCNKLCKFDGENNAYMIPWNILQLPPLLYVYDQIRIRAVSMYESINNILLYGTNYHFRDNNPIQIAHYLTKKIQKFDLSCNVNMSLYHLNLYGIGRGFFIETENIEHIEKIGFYIERNKLLEYDKFMIQHMTQKYSNNCCYVSFHNNTFENDQNYQNILHGINFFNYHNIQIEIVSNQNIEVKIYVITPNIMTYQDRCTVINDVRISSIPRFNVNNLFNCIEIINYESPINLNINNLATSFESSSIVAHNNLATSPIIVNSSNLISRQVIENDDLNNDSDDDSNDDLDNETIIITNEIKKVIDESEENDYCCIMQKTIRKNERYMSCYVCKKNFCYIAMQTWLDNRKTCPNCRTEWINNTIFINMI